MRKPLWLFFGLLVVGAVLSSAFVLFTPKIGHATRAQIDAALPASLKVQDAPDPAADARYARLVELVRGLDDREVSAAQVGSGSAAGLGFPPGGAPKPPDPTAIPRLVAKNAARIDGVEALLREGSIRYPVRAITTRFTDSTKLKTFAKLLALAMQDAATRGDRAACARLAILSLRYGRALLDGEGVIIDSLVAVASEAIAARAVYESDTAGGLDAAGREAVLGALPAEKGSLPELGGAVRRDFQQMFLPVLVDPRRYLTPENLVGERGDGSPRDKIAGTFDPVATARLAGAIYDAGMAEAVGTVSSENGRGAQLANAAGEGVPQTSDTGGPGGFWYRLRMNMGRNTLGRQLASQAIVFDGLAKAAQRRAAGRNLLRAVILLRMGRPADLPDPYGKGKLRVDAKRRIVWSVGEDGKDDGGDIVKRVGDKALDLGYRY